MPKSKSLKYDMKNEARLWSASKDWVGKDGLSEQNGSKHEIIFHLEIKLPLSKKMCQCHKT
jgi:hypothetical protein